MTGHERRSIKGREQFAIHKIRHRKIHAAFPERELLHSYHTWDALKSSEEIRFIGWVANTRRRPVEFAGSAENGRCIYNVFGGDLGNFDKNIEFATGLKRARRLPGIESALTILQFTPPPLPASRQLQ
jgi:hypothetical protein